MDNTRSIKLMGLALLALSAAGFLTPNFLPGFFRPENEEALQMMSALFSTLSLFCFFSRPKRQKL